MKLEGRFGLVYWCQKKKGDIQGNGDTKVFSLGLLMFSSYLIIGVTALCNKNN